LTVDIARDKRAMSYEAIAAAAHQLIRIESGRLGGRE